MDLRATGQSCLCSGFWCLVYGLQGRTVLIQHDLFGILGYGLSKCIYMRSIICFLFDVFFGESWFKCS